MIIQRNFTAKRGLPKELPTRYGTIERCPGEHLLSLGHTRRTKGSQNNTGLQNPIHAHMPHPPDQSFTIR